MIESKYMEKGPGFPFDNIVNADSTQKEKVKENWLNDNDEFSEKDKIKYAGSEQPLTQEKKNEIAQIENYANEIASRYGASEKSAPKVVLLKQGGVFEATKGEFKEGVCSPYRRRILIDLVPSKINFATNLSHEMFHSAGYTSLHFSKATNDVKSYRTGISLFAKDHDKIYFHEIEEALMAEATQILFDQYLRHDPLYAAEIQKTDFVKGWLRKYYDSCKVPSEKQDEIMDNIYSFPDVDDLIERLNGDDVEDFKLGFLHGYISVMLEDKKVIVRERIGERKKFYSLVDTILKNSDGKYANRQEVVDVFMRAHFSGRLLPLARMLEKSIAKGSFRTVANDFASYIKKEEVTGTYKEFNSEPVGELFEKRRKESAELKQRQDERMRKLRAMEKDGILYIDK